MKAIISKVAVFLAIAVVCSPVAVFAEETIESAASYTVESEYEGIPDQEQGDSIDDPEYEDPSQPSEPVVLERETNITGIRLNITQKAKSTITDTVRVYNAAGRDIKLQWYDPDEGKWSTRKSFNTTDEDVQDIEIKYTSKWWYREKSTWRLLMNVKTINTTDGEKGNDTRYSEFKSDTITVNAKRYYQNPSKYYQISNKDITIDGGGYTLKKGYMGFKVQKINKYFGIGNSYWPRYSSTTKSKVKKFQKKHGLKVTGNVNKATWMKIGDVRKKKKESRGYFTEYNWYHLGSYAYPNKTTLTMTKSECIDRFIKTAYKYKDAPYVVGGSGKSGQGADCSGLVIQCMYSCGIDPAPISSVRHSKPGYEYESKNLWKSKKLKKVSFKNRKRGDLIFYGDDGIVNHVAIYLGNNKVIHSWPNRIRVTNVRGWGTIMGARRVFN